MSMRGEGTPPTFKATGRLGGSNSRASSIARERLAAETADLPLRHAPRTERFVERDGGSVPVQHSPFEAAATAGVCQAGKMQNESFADSSSTKGGPHEQIFKVEAGLGEER